MENNMELEVYKKSDFYEDYISSQKEYYERTNADAYFAERLAEKDREIAELKQKLEDVQASAYAESVDAGMRERRLQRALWLARALRARDIQRWWIAATCAPKTERACSVWNNVEHKCRAKAEEYK